MRNFYFVLLVSKKIHKFTDFILTRQPHGRKRHICQFSGKILVKPDSCPRPAFLPECICALSEDAPGGTVSQAFPLWANWPRSHSKISSAERRILFERRLCQSYSLRVFVQRLHQKAHWPKAVVAGEHGGAGIFHPPVVEPLASVAQSQHKGR